MTNINLLPWREERRKQQQQDFILLLVLAAIAAGLVVFLWFSAVGAKVDNQRARNEHVRRELSLLDDQLKEIRDIKTRREELVSRMNVIQSLQNDRPTIVWLFDQLVKTLPEGVHYTSVTRRGSTFTILGIAESNHRVSTLMRNLDESSWFTKPDLKSVVAAPSGDANTFTLTVQVAAQEPEDAQGGGK